MLHTVLCLAGLVLSQPAADVGPAYAMPSLPTGPGVPLIASHSDDAGPDQSFVLVGEGFTNELFAWGPFPGAPGGHEIKLKVQVARPNLVMATLPDRSYDGPIVVRAKNAKGYSEPVVLNRPQMWWSLPDVVVAIGPNDRPRPIEIYGRCLAQRPDSSTPLVAFLEKQGGSTQPVEVLSGTKYCMVINLPASLTEGEYRLWCHAGRGGPLGWSMPLPLKVTPAKARRDRIVQWSSGSLQEAVDKLAVAGGGTLELAAGRFVLPTTLIVPAEVVVRGQGVRQTILQLAEAPAAPLPAIGGSAWNVAPGALHTPGDRLVYRAEFPRSGRWHVWLRYATEMSPWKQPGVSKRMSLAVDSGTAALLDNLPNTGGFGVFKWSHSATLDVTAGKHELTWKNELGGGISLDALVFALDAEYRPSENPLPHDAAGVLVVQGETPIRMETKEGNLPAGDRAAVWLAGDGAGVNSLHVVGNTQTNLGIAVRSREYPKWIENVRIAQARVSDCEGKQGENCAVRMYHAEYCTVEDNDLCGRVPLFFSGIRQCAIRRNAILPVTRFGGNAEASILSRNDTVRQCVVEQNRLETPSWLAAGGPSNRRLLWFSTGHGSVDQNYIAENVAEGPTIGGVAGTDQNVGEMILFEACERIAYFGPATSAAAASITIPARLPRTPDARLGNVKREMLATDAEGNETPFWPPDADDGSSEPPVGEYFVTVLAGRGQGQTRQVAARQGATYTLVAPWRVAPDASSTVLVHTAYWRNHIVGNRATDGMTGVQLWISCIENIVSGNVVARQRKPGLYLYGNCTTLASSMPCTWNRGIGPLYFNQIEGTRCDETSCGALLISGELGQLPVEFPRCLGNVLRHNSLVRSRTDGVLLTGNRPADEKQPSPAVLGTVVEFNVVRDAQVGYRTAPSVDATLLRRNHAYFWYPVSNRAEPPVAFQFDEEGRTAAIELNTIEGIHGVPSRDIRTEQRPTAGGKKP